MKKNKLFYIVVLTILSGFINSYTILSYGYTTSHLTGNLSNLAINVGLGTGKIYLTLFSIILAFLLGSFVTGFIFNKRKNTPYLFAIMPLGFSFLLLILSAFRLDSKLGLYGLAFISGMQNALPLSYMGVGIRTTHMTGYVTDLGWEMADLVRMRKKDPSKAYLYLASILFFVLGSYMGVVAVTGKSKTYLLILALSYFLLGLISFVKIRLELDRIK